MKTNRKWGVRVMSGSARGVPLETVPDMRTRPILDRVKKSLFSMLDAAGLLLDARVADLYAGTGTQGIEALSRGAEHCLFVEKRTDAVALLKANLEKTRLTGQAEVVASTVVAVLQRRAALDGSDPRNLFDLILYDPPFAFLREESSQTQALSELELAGRLLFGSHGRLVVRLEAKVDPPRPPGLEIMRHWKDGPHAFVFYRRAE